MGGIAPGLPPSVIPDKPLRFTDSPQHYASNTSSNAPTPSPRRKSSSTSNEDIYIYMILEELIEWKEYQQYIWAMLLPFQIMDLQYIQLFHQNIIDHQNQHILYLQIISKFISIK